MYLEWYEIKTKIANLLSVTWRPPQTLRLQPLILEETFLYNWLSCILTSGIKYLVEFEDISFLSFVKLWRCKVKISAISRLTIFKTLKTAGWTYVTTGPSTTSVFVSGHTPVHFSWHYSAHSMQLAKRGMTILGMKRSYAKTVLVLLSANTIFILFS